MYRERKLTPPMDIKKVCQYKFGNSNRFECEIWDVDGLKVYEFIDYAKPNEIWPNLNSPYWVGRETNLEGAKQIINYLLGVEHHGTYNLGL